MNLETFLKVMNIPSNLTIDEILDMLIIYLRKSRKDMEFYKDEPIEKTLQRHEKEIQDYIISIFGKPIPEHNIYREVASGDTIDDREVMQKVLSLIEKENIKGVVCLEIERLARGNTIDQGIIAQAFKYTNTRIITISPFSKIYNLDNEEDLSYFEDGLYQSRKFLTYTKRVLKRGRERSVKDGNYIGSIPSYGFTKVKNTGEKGHSLIQNESEAAIVLLIGNLYINGLNTEYIKKDNDKVTNIAKIFGITQYNIYDCNFNSKKGEIIDLIINNKKIPYTIKENDTIEKITKEYNIKKEQVKIPNDFFKNNEKIKIIIKDMRPSTIKCYLNFLKIKPRKSETWSANMVLNILNSPTAHGFVTWGKRRTEKQLINGKILKTRPHSNDYLEVKGKFPAIYDEQMSKAIKEKMERNKMIIAPEDSTIQNPLVGLVVCDICGKNMMRRAYYTRKPKTTLKRKYEVDKEELRQLLRSKKEKKGFSLNEIHRKLKTPKTTIDKWFANNNERFVIPDSSKWIQLKKLLDINETKFDESIMTFEEIKLIQYEDTLMCKQVGCTCVASKLQLVEERLIEALKIKLKEYNIYVADYEDNIQEEIDNNKNIIKSIEKEIEKVNIQMEKACEFYETGAYNEDLFLRRKKTLDEKLKSLLLQKQEFSKTNDITTKLENRKKAIPIIENILKNYSSELTPEERNELLSTIIKKIYYKKEKGGRGYEDNFTLKVLLRY